MNDKKTITVEIPVLDNVDQMKVVETFTEEQLWYVCVIAKAFEKTQSNWNSLFEYAKQQLEKAFDKVEQDTWEEVLEYMNELEGKKKQ